MPTAVIALVQKGADLALPDDDEENQVIMNGQETDNTHDEPDSAPATTATPWHVGLSRRTIMLVNVMMDPDDDDNENDVPDRTRTNENNVMVAAEQARQGDSICLDICSILLYLVCAIIMLRFYK